MSDNSDYKSEKLSEKAKRYIPELEKDIVACYGCQPRDDENRNERIWSWGVRYEMEDYLRKKNVPYEYWDGIINYMRCPQCGGSYSDGIGIVDKYEEEFYQKYDKIIEKTKGKIQSFYNYLSKYPYLGILHKVGTEIMEEIKKMPIKTITDVFFYRARKMENGKIFTSKDMLNPPPKTKFIPEGRFNHFGQSHLYLGDSEKLCASEISNEKQELLWMQKYKIKQLTQVLDVSVFIDLSNIDKIPQFFLGLLYSGMLKLQKSNEISWAPAYFIPRFIADVAKAKNINGIIYDSEKAFGRNLVIFDTEKCEYELVGDPYTFKFSRESHNSQATPTASI